MARPQRSKSRKRGGSSRRGAGKAAVPEPLTPACFHVLLALADGPLHGYAIMQAANRSSGGKRMGPGTIYGTLQRLLDGAQVRELDSVDATSERQRRRTFELTAEGRRALLDESQRLVRLAELVQARQLVAEPGCD